MGEPLRIIIVEDSENDVLLLVRQLQKSGFEPCARRVETADGLAAALADGPWDVVLSDYTMPQMDAPRALGILQSSGLDIPFIVISGTVGEDVAVQTMKAGAHDYLLKSSLTRLGEAIRREMRDAAIRREHKKTIKQIEHLNRVLTGIRNVNQLIVREKDPAALLRECCSQMVGSRGYDAAWIAVDRLDGAPARLVAQQGFGEEFGAMRRQLEQGLVPPCCELARQAGTVHVVRDSARECPPDCASLQTDRSSCRLAAMTMVAPLRANGRASGFMCVAIPRGLQIDDEETSLVGEVAGDIAFALHSIESEAARRQAETALQRRMEIERSLAEANEAKDLFFNTLSHELRTPLAAMLNSLEVLKTPQASEAQRSRAMDLLGRNVRHQTRLIDDLLDLSRIMRQKVEIAREPLDLRDIVNVQAEASAAGADKRRIALSLELPDEPVLVVGDSDRLGQIVSNLLGNALKFTDAGGSVRVTVCTEADQAVVRVADTGIGVAPDTLPHLFEAFRQVSTSMTRSAGGLGIGLAVARSLAELHGGTVDGASKGLDQGSDFVLRLPLCTEQTTAPEAPGVAAGTTGGLRVLVVEDGPDLLESMTMLLELMGHDVITAEDGNSGIAIARREQPDIALIDIGLPDMDGYEVAHRLRADAATRAIRLAALTGYATPEHRVRALRVGFHHHLAKPVDVEQLRQLLGQVQTLCPADETTAPATNAAPGGGRGAAPRSER